MEHLADTHPGLLTAVVWLVFGIVVAITLGTLAWQWQRGRLSRSDVALRTAAVVIALLLALSGHLWIDANDIEIL
jgi:hypothetical protein